MITLFILSIGVIVDDLIETIRAIKMIGYGEACLDKLAKLVCHGYGEACLDKLAKLVCHGYGKINIIIKTINDFKFQFLIY
jgi:hypothetical protein